MSISTLDLADATAAFREQFWLKVDRTESESCWPWLGYRKSNGYGQVYISRGRFVTASRVAYGLTHGVVPAGQVVCHHCDNPPCCNPEHLFIGTQSVNALDSVQKGRANRARGEQHPHARLTEDQVREIRNTPAYSGINRDFADQFGVSRRHIYAIRSGKKWGHLRGAP
jgi:hypothetical protein